MATNNKKRPYLKEMGYGGLIQAGTEFAAGQATDYLDKMNSDGQYLDPDIHGLRKEESVESGVLGGAITGAATGAAIGPLGAAAGAVGGAVFGAYTTIAGNADIRNANAGITSKYNATKELVNEYDSRTMGNNGNIQNAAEGGQLPNDGAYREYNVGGSHMENPNGGIPVDSKGNPTVVSGQSPVAKVEQGEVAANVGKDIGSYIFSKKLKVGSGKKKTPFAKEAKRIHNKYKFRVDNGDSLAKDQEERELISLREKQEFMKEQLRVQRAPMQSQAGEGYLPGMLEGGPLYKGGTHLNRNQLNERLKSSAFNPNNENYNNFNGENINNTWNNDRDNYNYKNDDVFALQKELRELGFYGDSYDANTEISEIEDGKWGPKTMNAYNKYSAAFDGVNSQLPIEAGVKAPQGQVQPTSGLASTKMQDPVSTSQAPLIKPSIGGNVPTELPQSSGPIWTPEGLPDASSAPNSSPFEAPAEGEYQGGRLAKAQPPAKDEDGYSKRTNKGSYDNIDKLARKSAIGPYAANLGAAAYKYSAADTNEIGPNHVNSELLDLTDERTDIKLQANTARSSSKNYIANNSNGSGNAMTNMLASEAAISAGAGKGIGNSWMKEQNINTDIKNKDAYYNAREDSRVDAFNSAERSAESLQKLDAVGDAAGATSRYVKDKNDFISNRNTENFLGTDKYDTIRTKGGMKKQFTNPAGYQYHHDDKGNPVYYRNGKKISAAEAHKMDKKYNKR